MSKKRIHELAKEYGMSGKELAGKLRDLGFTHIKNHMTALDEFEELQVEGVLGAHGFNRQDVAFGGLENDLGTGVIRRKKKNKQSDGDDSGDDDASPALTKVADPEPEELARRAPAAAELAPAQEEAAAPVAKAHAATDDSEQAAATTSPATGEPEVRRKAAAEKQVEIPRAPAPAESIAPAAEVAKSAPAEEAASATTAAAAAPEAQPETSSAAEVAASTASRETQSEARESAVADAGARDVDTGVDEDDEVGASVAGTGATKSASKLKGGKHPKVLDLTKAKATIKQVGPAGKVVGFIDLSKLQVAPKKSESRRLRSRDDVMPDVRPTLRHDSKNSMLRGDRGSRNSLTAAQLREREAGRYKRHLRGGGGGASGGGGRGRNDRGRSARPMSDGSPYAGQTIKIEMPITIKKLAEAMSIKGSELLNTGWREKLLEFGSDTIVSAIDKETASLLANEFEVELEFIDLVEAEDALIEGLKAKRDAIEDQHLERRNPTVAFLGHVDHGKTTLIDKIRNSTVAEGEHGGITQHIGAYRVRNELGHYVTIIDTPGHAAFTGMRARGAQAVDVVVLVVAADAGVQPQTQEALAHARAAKVPIVVALNKIDRAEANVQKTLEQLAGIDVIPEQWGGEVAVMPVSGLTGEGIQELLERIHLESEILELACHPEGPASGIVLEAEVQQGKGIVAHLLIRDGTLERGNVILAGEGYGKVRSIHDDFGNEIMTAGPSVPVEVSGLSALPGIGEPFHVVEKLDEAKKVAEERARKNRAASIGERRKFDNASLLQQVSGPAVSEVNVIIRADVQGTVEVLKAQISEPIHSEVEARVLQAGVGAVTENDVLLASASNAMIVAFNVATGAKARQAAEREGVEIRNFNILYNVLDTIRALMEGRLAPDVSEEVTGHVEIRKLFRSSKIGNIAGCYVLDGTIARDSKVRVLRDDQVIYTGVLASLRRESDDAKEVREGFECGLVVRNYNDVRDGDIIEAYKIVETKRTLDSPPLSN